MPLFFEVSPNGHIFEDGIFESRVWLEGMIEIGVDAPALAVECAEAREGDVGDERPGEAREEGVRDQTHQEAGPSAETGQARAEAGPAGFVLIHELLEGVGTGEDSVSV
jgi:hypothetical protein